MALASKRKIHDSEIETTTSSLNSISTSAEKTCAHNHTPVSSPRKKRKAIEFGDGGHIPLRQKREGYEAMRSFYDLPAELRNQIYELALLNPDPIAITSKKLHKAEPNLLFASKKIRAEARNMFYHINSFQTDSMDVSYGFLASLPKLQLRALKDLKIGDPYKAAETPVEVLLEDARIESYIVEYNQPWATPGRKEARMKLEGVLEKNQRVRAKYGPPPTPMLPPGMEYLRRQPQNQRSLDLPRSLRAIRHAHVLFQQDFGRKGLGEDVVRVEMLAHLPANKSQPTIAIEEAMTEWRYVSASESKQYKSVAISGQKYSMPVAHRTSDKHRGIQA